MSATNVEIARRGYEAALRGDFEALREILDPEVKWHGGDPAAGCQNREQTLEFMRQARTRGELVEVLGASDKVVVILRRKTEDGEPAELVANVTTFRDGKAIEMVHYPNPDDARTAAGV